MMEIVESYKELRQHMGVLIQKSGYKNSFLAERVGIPTPNFSAKKKRGNWTVEEVEKLLSIIENDELENYFLSEIMKDASKGDNGSIEDLMSALKA